MKERKLAKSVELMHLPSYQPDLLLDFVRQKLGVHTDRAMCKILGFSPVSISKIRHRRIAVGAELLLAMHEETEVPIKELKALMGDHRDTSIRSKRL